MASSYTVKLLAFWAASTRQVPLWTVPDDGWAYVARHICIGNFSSSAAQMRLGLKTGAAFQEHMLWADPQVPSATARLVDLRQRLDPGEQLVVTSTAAPYSVLLTGYKFSGG